MSEARFQAVNPATGVAGEVYPFQELSDCLDDLAAAVPGQAAWASRPVAERAAKLPALAQALREQADSLARAMAEEMGKPLVEGRAEIEKCAGLCDYYATQASEFLSDEEYVSSSSKACTVYTPLGFVLGVMPWNFPFWQVFRFGVPALVAGNSLVIKHAPNVPCLGKQLEEIFHAVELPVHNLRLTVGDTLELIKHPLVQGVSLTGSTRAGRAVASAAGQALKKTVLELGGSDPYLVLEDADIELAAQACVTSRLINSGQSCIAAKRWIVVEGVYDDFARRVTELMADQVVGDPLDEQTQLGPLARVDLRDQLMAQVDRSIEAGAHMRWSYEGDLPEAGAWFPPLILEEVEPGMPAFDEELFGPVGVLIRAGSEAHAVQLANHTVYGLGAAVFTQDIARGERLAREALQAGCVVVNDFVRSDPRLPFGGIRDSGYGRELARMGLLEFTNAKTVVIS